MLRTFPRLGSKGAKGSLFCAALLLGLVLIAASPTAWADSAAESPSANVNVEPPPAGQSAAELAAYAKSLFLAERYVEAADMLVAAYQEAPRPIYLFNAAQSYRKGNAPNKALAAYESFITVAESDALAAEARTYARDMRTLIDAQERSQTVRLELESERQAAAEKERALQAEQERRLRMEAELERTRHPPFYKRAVFWGIVSPIVALGIVAGIAVPLQIKAAHDANQTDGGSFTITLPLGN
jgi:hypothetical protein